MNSTRALIHRIVPLAFVFALFLSSPSFAEDKDSPVAVEMKGMNKDFKQLKKQIADPTQKASSLDLIASMEKHAKTAQGLTPPNAEKVPATERAVWITDYRKKMDDLLAAFDKLQADVSGDKLDDAKAMLDNILTIKREGHQKFAKEEK